MSGLETRLRRLEEQYVINRKEIYMFVIDDGQEFETKEQLDEELKKPKYENAIVVIDNRKDMRWLAER